MTKTGTTFREPDYLDLPMESNNTATRRLSEESAAVDAMLAKKTGPVVLPLAVVDAFTFLQMSFPPRENLLTPWLPLQGLCMVHAYRGVGKTHIALGIACAVATGSSFLTWKADKPHGVLFIDGEMPGVVLQERFAQTIVSMDSDIEKPLLGFITPDLQEFGMPDLSTVEGQLRVEPFITDDIKLIILDNLSTLCGSQQENKGDTWREMQEWILQLRARGKSVLMIHHDGKGGQQRGHSKKEDILDTIIQLKRPIQYSPSDGAVFEVHFTKSRGLHGEDVEPFEASLLTVGEETVWLTRKIEDSTKEKIKKLLDDGLKQKDIAIELDITAGRVSQLVKQIKLEV